MIWNPVQEFFVEVKSEFINMCGKTQLWNYGCEDSFTNCLSYWVWTLGNHVHPKRHYYRQIIEPLMLHECMGMLLIKYKSLDIDWDIYDGFYRECRSVVIDVVTNKLVLTPFRKFFNINEREDTQLSIVQKKIKNAKNIEITDKIDGSMASCRWYQHDIVMSGSQSLDMSTSYRLTNYYNWMYDHENALQMVKDYQNCTFIFEGVFPDDVHVVQYNEQMFGLHLLGIRRIMNGQELPYAQVVEIAEKYNVPHVKIFDISLVKFMNKEVVGKFIKEQRAKIGITQQDLAEILCTSRENISKWERGLAIPNTEYLKPLCKTLKVPITDLLAGKIESDKEDASNVIYDIMDTNQRIRKRFFKIFIRVFWCIFYSL